MNLSGTAKGMIRTICISALIIGGLGAIVFRSMEGLYFAIGVILTSALNALKVVMLERNAGKAVEMDESKTAANYIRMQYLLRFFLTGAVLTVAAICPYVNLWGAAAGIVTLQIAALFSRFYKEDGVADKQV